MPKRRVFRFREENRDIFEMIRSGKKRIETRAASPKYIDIQAGDQAVLVCGPDRFLKRIRAVRHFRTVAAMLKVYGVRKISPRIASAAALHKVYAGFPGYKEKIRAHGILAFELG
ncbi:MAG: hypothetical protein AAB692_02895 [Patescibacteria group bacterium]